MSVGSLEALLQQARARSQKRDAPGAVTLYRQALDVDPDSAEALEGLAMVLFQAGDLPGAIEQFIRLTMLQPQEARHHVNLGAVYNRKGQHSQAADALRKAIQRDRRSADAYYNLGIAQRKLNQSSMAVSAYKEAIRLNPLMAEAYQNLGNVYTEMGNHQLAIMNFQKALEIRPEFEKARVGLQRAEDALEKSKSASSPFGRLVTADRLEAELPASDASAEHETPLDRQQVLMLAHELRLLTEAYRDVLKNRLEPAIHALQRVVAESKVSTLSLARAITDLHEAYELWLQRSREVKQKATELRDLSRR
jgi:tetratricopeptide (TPR) repeat protein